MLCHPSVLVAGTTLGQCWVGEQPQAEAHPLPHVPGRADPVQIADQGTTTQCGDSQGPANSCAGEGLAGPGLPWGFPGASLGLQRPALLLCPGQVSSEMGQLPCASVSPLKGVCLCCILPLL